MGAGCAKGALQSVPGMFGDPTGTLQRRPGIPPRLSRGASGVPWDAPRVSGTCLGAPRTLVWDGLFAEARSRCSRNVFRMILASRVGRPTCDSYGFFHTDRLSSLFRQERSPDTKKLRKSTVLAPKTDPDDPKKSPRDLRRAKSCSRMVARATRNAKSFSMHLFRETWSRKVATMWARVTTPLDSLIGIFVRIYICI